MWTRGHVGNFINNRTIERAEDKQMDLQEKRQGTRISAQKFEEKYKWMFAFGKEQLSIIRLSRLVLLNYNNDNSLFTNSTFNNESCFAQCTRGRPLVKDS